MFQGFIFLMLSGIAAPPRDSWSNPSHRQLAGNAVVINLGYN
jgi:hypothetical protein